MTSTRNLRIVFTTAALAAAFALTPLATRSAQAQVDVAVDVSTAPPPIPAYDQPEIPGDGYIWTPGYWAYGPGGYYWVQGAWVEPPYVGALWTPGWWGFGGGGYLWNAGYWGRSIGYYGGINYGFGYFGTGFYGGYWGGGRFFYNRAYCHYGYGFRGNFYESRFHGYDGRPGGPAFNAHPPVQYTGFHHEGGPERSTFNGNQFHANEGVNRSNSYGARVPQSGGIENRGAQNQLASGAHNDGPRNGVTAPTTPHDNYGGGNRYGSPASAPRSYEPPTSNRGPQGGFNRPQSAPAPQQQRAPQQSGHSFSAPGGGGGFHGGGGGGGGFHGGRR